MEVDHGAQKLDLFKRPVEKALRERMGDIWLAGCQHFAFKEYLDPHGNILFAGHSNGSVSFQLEQNLCWCRQSSNFFGHLH
jgi:hypothetical protein